MRGGGGGGGGGSGSAKAHAPAEWRWRWKRRKGGSGRKAGGGGLGGQRPDAGMGRKEIKGQNLHIRNAARSAVPSRVGLAREAAGAQNWQQLTRATKQV